MLVAEVGAVAGAAVAITVLAPLEVVVLFRELQEGPLHNDASILHP